MKLMLDFDPCVIAESERRIREAIAVINATEPIIILIEDFEERHVEARRKQLIEKLAPPMARFNLGNGTAVGVITKKTHMGVKVKLRTGQPVFRRFKKDNVRCYPAGIILKN